MCVEYCRSQNAVGHIIRGEGEANFSHILVHGVMVVLVVAALG